MNSESIQQLLSQTEDVVNKLKLKREMESEIELQMQQMFAINMAALEKRFPKLWQQFSDYQSRKLKLFVTDTGQVNVIDPDSEIPLYGNQPIEDSESHVEQFLTDPVISQVRFAKESHNTFNAIHVKYMNQLLDSFENATVAKKEELRPEFIGNLMILGVGLGYHIPALLSKVEVQHMTVYEPDSDLFFASLHTLNWANILDYLEYENRSIYFNIGSSPELFSRDLYNYFRHYDLAYVSSFFVYRHAETPRVNKGLAEVQKRFRDYIMGWGFFDDSVIGLSHFYDNLKTSPKILLNHTESKQLRHLTAVVVGNGPSLDNSIPYLKKHREQLVIISCGSALTALYNAGITPEYHAEIERMKVTHTRLAQLPKEYMNKITLLAGNVLHPDCAKEFKNVLYALKSNDSATTFFREVIGGDADKFRPLGYCNPLCANAGAAFAGAFGFRQIVFAGVDCGVKDVKYHHSKHSAYYSNDGEQKGDMGLMDENQMFLVDGNFGGKVKTNIIFSSAQLALEEVANSNKDIMFFNMSDGALIKGVTPLEPELFSPLLTDTPIVDMLSDIEDQLFATYSIPQDVDPYERIDTEGFKKINQVLISKLEGPFTSQEGVILSLESIQAALYVYRKNKPHIFNALEGTVAYFSTMMKMAIYELSKEERFKVASDMAQIFIQYLKEAEEMFEKAFEHKDNRVCEVTMKNFSVK